MRHNPEGIAAEMFEHDPNLFKPMQPLLQLGAFRWREFQRNRNQQLLRCIGRAAEFFIIIFVIHAFMCGVLVNQIQPLIVLRDQIGAVMLSDQGQLGERRKLRLRRRRAVQCFRHLLQPRGRQRLPFRRAARVGGGAG
ncbi:hypothetical protein D3C81_1682980 [compost metagenome]